MMKSLIVLCMSLALVLNVPVSANTNLNKAATAVLNGRILTVHADANGGTIVVTQTGNVLQVGSLGTFNASNIQLIRYVGSSKNDVFDCTGVNIPTQMFGEAGDDVLIGGKKGDRIYGGTGNDKLHGNEGNDYLDGWKGSDELYGGLGMDTGYDYNANEPVVFDSVEIIKYYT